MCEDPGSCSFFFMGLGKPRRHPDDFESPALAWKLVPQFPHWKQPFLVCGLSAREKWRVLVVSPATLVWVELVLPLANGFKEHTWVPHIYHRTFQKHRDELKTVISPLFASTFRKWSLFYLYFQYIDAVRYVWFYTHAPSPQPPTGLDYKPFFILY